MYCTESGSRRFPTHKTQARSARPGSPGTPVRIYGIGSPPNEIEFMYVPHYVSEKGCRGLSWIASHAVMTT